MAFLFPRGDARCATPSRSRSVSFYAAAAALFLAGFAQNTLAQFDNLQLEPVADLGAVIDISHAGDNRLFFSTQFGAIHVYQDGQLLDALFLDLTGTVNSSGFEQGLLGLAFHPNYAENGFFYVNYTDDSDATVIARYSVDPANANRADPTSGVTLMTIPQPFTNHNGGQVKFGPDGFLYIGMGDGGSGGDPTCRAQKPDELLGKMLRIDVNQNIDTPPYYGIPADNPFLGNQDYHPEIWATGLRNPWRFSFDRETGDIFIGDVGQNAREEISWQPASSGGGENYGWDRMEGSACFENDQSCPMDTPPCDDPSITLPIIDYTHTSNGSGCASVTGGYMYRGRTALSLVGWYLYADYCSGNLWAARPVGEQWQTRRLNDGGPLPQLSGTATFGEDIDGDVYIRNGSAIYRFTETCPYPTGTLLPYWNQTLASGCLNGFVDVLDLVAGI